MDGKTSLRDILWMMQRYDISSHSTGSVIIPLQTFQKSSPGEPGIVKSSIKEEDRSKEKQKRFYICIYCSNLITSPSDVIEVDGSHHHTFINPAGISFHIGCFKTAQGCRTWGEPTREFTWFPGFSWSMAVCSHCYTHMGWLYQSGASSFYGLILENITENM